MKRIPGSQTRNATGQSVEIPRHSNLRGPAPGPQVPGGPVARTTPAPPSKTTANRPAPIPKLAAQPSHGSHISPEVRADLGKLSPELARGIRTVADRK
jgi:hypothetical protein